MKSPMIPLLAAVLCLPVPAAEVEDFRFKAEVLAGDLPQPMALQFAPDGRIFLIEIAGAVKILDPETREMKLAGKLEVTTAIENGLLGMALDPGFADNHWIYLYHSPHDFDGQILSRFTVMDDQLAPASRVDLLKVPEQRRECCHHGGTLRFGPDGDLFISSGDNTNPFGSDGFAPLDERADRDPWDAQKSSANTNDLRGKILRIRPLPDGSYEIPEGNLFPPGTPETRPEIYAMGFRNAWRFSVDPESGTLYVGDVGPDSGSDRENRGPNGFDTLNRITRPGNYGWPYSRGGRVYHDFDFTSQRSGPGFNTARPLNDSPNNTGLRELPPIQAPLVWYPGRPTEDFPLLGEGGRTACGGPVFHFKDSFRETGGFPEHFDGCVLFYDWQRPFIFWLRLDPEGNLDRMEPFTGVVKVAQGPDERRGPLKVRRPVDMTFGPDGALYLLDYGETWGANKDARLTRISYQRGNLDPVARATADTPGGLAPLGVSLTAAGSSDPEGVPLGYEWRVLPDDAVIARTETATITLNVPGNHTARLTVTDGKGGSAKAEVPIIVGNSPPEIVIVEPKDGSFFNPGEPIRYQAAVRDAEDGRSNQASEAMTPRTLVNATWMSGGGAEIGAEPGLTLMKQADCFNCHSIDQPLIGPSLIAIAEKYRGDPGAQDNSVKRVIEGSSGVWGEVGMLPHPQLNPDQTHIMIRWILSLEPGKASPSMNRGLTGEIQVPQDPSLESCLVEATYVDAGNPPAGPLSASRSIRLRARKIQTENAGVQGPTRMGGSGSEGSFLGAINDGHGVDLGPLDLRDSKRAVLRAASGGVGGLIELRLASADGEMLGSVAIPPTGGWDQWREFEIPIRPTAGDDSVHVVFSNPGKGGLMNLDWIRFDR